MKSHESDLLELLANVFRDVADMCNDATPDLRDLRTIRKRVEHEGLSFLTLTLPSLGKDFERCLSLGEIDSTLFRSFKKKGKAPAFLSGYFSRVFDIWEGSVLDEPSAECVVGIRQIAYTFKKLKVECSPNRVRAALRKFTESEQAIKVFQMDPSDAADFSSVSRVLWGAVFGSQGANLDITNSVPKHGPGATAEKLSGNAKFKVGRWHDRLEPYFPILDTLFANANGVHDSGFKQVKIVPEHEEQPVRVITVPKTLKGPRIIAIEPVCMQYAQQALSRDLVDLLEGDRFTAGHINFSDQQVNRDLAIRASKDRSYATLDMSSASDLVPYEVAISMFDRHPDLKDAISACRSTRAELPGGRVINLRKFASMGSALCFPVEAMYFYTCCVVALLRWYKLPCTMPNVYAVGRGIYVYGDDIIVPTHTSQVVMETLQKYCCKVNAAKSFTEGNFRESCGMDAYAGYDVTPTYLRNLLPHGKQATPQQMISLVATRNLFYERAFYRTAKYLKSQVEARLGSLPIVSSNCSGLGWLSHTCGVTIGRWGYRYQRPEVEAWVPSEVYQEDHINGWPALNKCLIRTASSKPFQDEKHLKRSARHGAVTLKRRWVAVRVADSFGA